MKLVVVVFIAVLIIGVIFIIFLRYTNKKSNYPLTKMAMKLTSPVFTEGGIIPQKYTCDGANISPPLQISEIPTQTISLALIVTDPDAPMGTFTHWVLWNIDPRTIKIDEGSVPQGARVGENDFGNTDYKGPCPPSGTHRYIFTLFALNAVPIISKTSVTRQSLEKDIMGHILEQTTLTVKYGR